MAVDAIADPRSLPGQGSRRASSQTATAVSPAVSTTPEPAAGWRRLPHLRTPVETLIAAARAAKQLSGSDLVSKFGPSLFELCV